MKNLLQGTSRQEISVFNFINTLMPETTVLKNNRQVLNGKELDIYVPSRKFAVEFNGLYFHNDSMKNDPFYHLQKSVECEKKGIRLIQIMSDEWEQKKPLVLDLIRKSLGKCDNVSLQNCKIVEISKQEGDLFMKRHCLLEEDPHASLYYAILLDNEKMAVASFKKEKNWTLTRYVERMGFTVHSGLKKIIDEFKTQHSLPLTATLDRRLYQKYDFIEAGFEEIEPTNPNVTITKDFKKRFPLKEKTSDEKLEKQGWHKVYDCGNRRFLLCT